VLRVCRTCTTTAATGLAATAAGATLEAIGLRHGGADEHERDHAGDVSERDARAR